MTHVLELKRISELIPVELWLLFVLVAKTEPRMIAPMISVVRKQVGMANLFLRCQGRLLSVMKNTFRKICDLTYSVFG